MTNATALIPRLIPGTRLRRITGSSTTRHILACLVGCAVDATLPGTRTVGSRTDQPNRCC